MQFISKSHREKESLSVALCSLLIGIGYSFHLLRTGTSLETDAEQFLSGLRLVLIFLPVFVLSQAAMNITFRIIDKRLGGEPPTKGLDEREQKIELRALRFEYYFMSVGIFATAAVSLAFESVSLFFVLFIALMVCSSISSNVYRYLEFGRWSSA